MESRRNGKPTDQEQARATSSTTAASSSTASKDSFQLTAPSISLPKGGGAIRGIGEKFSANPVTGTGSMTVPIALSPGRGGFGPQLALSYDSGAGNGPFGLGWNLSLPSIVRKTDKGLPRYLDGEDSDIFILAGAEDLVPTVRTDGTLEPDVTVYRTRYQIRRYRPRIEGLFALIERWVEHDHPANTFWRTISRDNITTWYGRDEESRIFDPEHPSHIFQWLVCQINDDKGNVSLYQYISDDSRRVDVTAAAEVNRRNVSRTVNRYLKRILYGNKGGSYLPKLAPSAPADALPSAWMFEAVFDYGDHPGDIPSLAPSTAWPARPDAFSTHRAGFEVRTYRLCRRVLMFHHFQEELRVADYLVRSTEFLYDEPAALADPLQPGYTTLREVTHRSYERVQRGPGQPVEWLWRQLPPVTFEYSKPIVDQTVHSIDAAQLENLPVGTQGPGYQWVDIDGEGLTGVLTEQAGTWYYKANLGQTHFGPLQVVARKPAMASLASGRQQFMDLAGDGDIDLVDFSGPTPGFHERDHAEGWTQFVPFASLPNIDWNDANLRFVDLTGDGHADALITEQDVLTWYPSRAEAGFDAAERRHLAVDEQAGPRVVFADGTQTMFLADMCGDGLTDLVRIRNGEVCYWPNLGYGRFGRKVTLANSPRFDHPDLFDPHRLRLADIDGSGPIDIIYLGRDGARLYFNRSGNSVSNPLTVALPIATENLAAVQVADLLGNGTACLVWNSHLPADAARPVRYIDLMGGHKPHLMTQVTNNLGATTTIEYRASTHFYVQDKLAGTPWITRLSFPVHCVSKVTVKDTWRETEFSSTYSYHHGYFDGIEREFRGFGRVEQVDIERFDDLKLDQPPVKTVTWYHTGAALDRRRILTQFAQEYFPARYPFDGDFHERALPEPELPADVTAEEWREALRACKGMVLRQESYELDPASLAQPTSRHKPVRLFSAATHNCHIQRLQRRGTNRHAVFLVTESEALTYHYELPLPELGATVQPDPRIAHQLTLRHDEYGNPQQSVAIGYRRWKAGDFTDLPGPELLAAVQAEEHVAYTEIRYTDDVELPAPPVLPAEPRSAIRHRRLRLPCETLTYELTGSPKIDARYFRPADFAKVVLSEVYGPLPGAPAAPQTVPRKEYHEHVPPSVLGKRLVEHTRTLFFNDESDTAPPNNTTPLPFRKHGPRGLKYEDYKLALTDALLTAVFGDKLSWSVGPGKTVRQQLVEPLNPAKPQYLASGYMKGEAIAPNFAGQYWMRSGTAGFADDAGFANGAHNHFFLPERYTDPFGNETKVEYDERDLFIQSSTDAKGNVAKIAVGDNGKPRFDYRVLAPLEMVDANGNHAEVIFDMLGLPVAAAVKGKETPPASDTWEGDNLSDFDFALRNPSLTAIQSFCTATTMDVAKATTWLGHATTRFVYHFGDATHPPGACAIARERHKDAATPLHVSLECSDGVGNVLMKKQQAEPEQTNGPLRWIVNGLTVLNNKGKPVKQYEPDFSELGFGCERPLANGVSTTLYYDAAGRVIRTDLPDGTFSKVEFSPWHAATYDANDTVLDSAWYRTNGRNRLAADLPLPVDPLTQQPACTPDERAGWLTARHANTPARVFLDSLGREVVAIAHNRVEDANGSHTFGGTKWKDDYYLTFTKLDAEGKPLWICDARGNLVMQYITPAKPNHTSLFESGNPDNWRAAYDRQATAVPCYDIAGNLLFQHSMDAGDRWTINDAAGKPMFAWDVYRAVDDNTAPVERRLYLTEYDGLHRPLALKFKTDSNPAIVIERFEYQDGQLNPANNLNGQLIKHYDASGLVETIAMDFKGQPLQIRRRLVVDQKSTVTDWQGNLESKLSSEIFIQITEYDALSRMTRLFNWHQGNDSRVAVYLPQYGERGVLKSEKLIVGATKNNSATGYSGGQDNDAIAEIRYNVKGQREFLKLGNGVSTSYTYDARTFRLMALRSERAVSETCANGTGPMFENGRVVQDLHYWYDPVANITEIADPAFKTVFFNNQAVKPINRYEYDALYRLIVATGRENGVASGAPTNLEGEPLRNNFPCIAANAFRNYTQRFRYDPVGNIQQMRHEAGSVGGWTRDYAYAFEDGHQPASNRLWQTWTGGDRTQPITHHYDTHGSMLNLANVPDDYRIQWDHRDMIASINSGGGQAQYQYDASKQRTRKWIAKNHDTIVEERLYLGGLELYRRRVNDVLKEEIETLHLFDGEQRLLMVDQILETDRSELGRRTLYRYTLSNHLGSSTLELDQQAGMISYEEYHPYGTSAYRAGRNAVEVKLKRYRYTGMERDEESGLSYHTARYYLPWLGRWGSTDPGGFSDGLNLYAFARNSPVGHLDTNGEEVVSATAAYVIAAETGGLSATASVGTWSATIGVLSGTSTGTAAPAAGIATTTAAPVAGIATGTSTGSASALGSVTSLAAPALAMLTAIVVTLAIMPSILFIGFKDIEDRSARYSASAQEADKKKHEEARAPEHYVGEGNEKTGRQLLGLDKIPRTLPGGDKSKIPAIAPSRKPPIPATDPPKYPRTVIAPGAPAPNEALGPGTRDGTDAVELPAANMAASRGPHGNDALGSRRTRANEIRKKIQDELSITEEQEKVVDDLIMENLPPNTELPESTIDKLKQLDELARQGNKAASAALRRILPNPSLVGQLIAEEIVIREISPTGVSEWPKTVFRDPCLRGTE